MTRTVSVTLTGDTTDISDAMMHMEGPRLADLIVESREQGISDSEILDVLVTRLKYW